MSLPSWQDVQAVGFAWARVLPAVTLVPAFGLRALPAPIRGVVALGLAASIFPALLPFSRARTDTMWGVAMFEQMLAGVPIAIAAAVPLWAATMAGGVADSLRGASESVQLSVVEERTASFGALFSLFASASFLATGGPSRVASALARTTQEAPSWLHVAHTLTAGIEVAIAIAGPLLAASVVLEVAFALVARASSPAQTHALLSPLRALGLLTLAGLAFDRIGRALASFQSTRDFY